MSFPYHSSRDCLNANFGGLVCQLLHATLCVVTVMLLLFKVLCNTSLLFCISPYHDGRERYQLHVMLVKHVCFRHGLLHML